MKAFTKWWAENVWMLSDESHRYDAEPVWKAALEWIRREGVISDGELAGKLIEEELKE